MLSHRTRVVHICRVNIHESILSVQWDLLLFDLLCWLGCCLLHNLHFSFAEDPTNEAPMTQVGA